MKLSVHLSGIKVDKWDRVRLEYEFRDAVLDWQPSVEKLLEYKLRRNIDYYTMVKKGIKAVRDIAGEKKTKGMRISLEIK